MTLKKALTSVLAVALLAGGTLALTAFRGHHDPARFDRFVSHRIDDMLDDVHATDAQRQKIGAIRDRLLADAKTLHAGRGDAVKALLAQWQADRPDAARVHAVVDGRADAMKRFADEVSDAVLQVHGILTPEQRAQITKKLQRRVEE
jgi:Spy/CpxP family protein refolding chaperone